MRPAYPGVTGGEQADSKVEHLIQERFTQLHGLERKLAADGHGPAPFLLLNLCVSSMGGFERGLTDALRSWPGDPTERARSESAGVSRSSLSLSGGRSRRQLEQQRESARVGRRHKRPLRSVGSSSVKRTRI
jgi:hypothetical protein